MSKSRFAKRVGLFVVIALMVFVGLIVIFTKSGGFKPMYELRLRAETVANLKRGSLVLMAGVYALTLVLDNGHPAWGFVRAFSEAATSAASNSRGA